MKDQITEAFERWYLGDEDSPEIRKKVSASMQYHLQHAAWRAAYKHAAQERRKGLVRAYDILIASMYAIISIAESPASEWAGGDFAKLENIRTGGQNAIMHADKALKEEQ